jgi:hypothetical protein
VDQQQELKLTARVVALEHLVQQMLYMIAAGQPDPLHLLKDFRERYLRELGESFVRGASAEMSDLLMQEMTEAADNVLSALIERLERGQAS